MEPVAKVLSKWKLHNGGWSAGYTGNVAYVGRNGSAYYTVISKFECPKFPEGYKINKLTLSLAKYIQAGITTARLRWAICTSDDNKDRYITHLAVNDDKMLLQGVVTLDNISNIVKVQEFDIECPDGLTPGQTYYLFLWSADDTSVGAEFCSLYAEQSAINFTFDLAGIVYISNGTGFDVFRPYISDGSQFTPIAPYISNGQAWNQLS